MPDMEIVLVECSPSYEWGNTGQEGVDPDEDEGEQSGKRGGEGELPVFGHHHVPLQG